MPKGDHDGWDPASSVGLTATEAAAARAVASRKHATMVSDQYAEPLLHALGIDFYTQLAQRNDESAFAMPGMVDWVAARTRFFDDYFAATQAAGIRQSVILGAGLDSRAFRLAWPSGSTLYEVDQPGVVEFKSGAMAQLDAQPRVDRRTVAVDLRDEWVTALRDSGFDPAVPTAWSAEGLMPYLPPLAQEQLLDNVSELSADGSWFAADTVGDVGELAARISSMPGVRERPSQIRVEIGAAIATSPRAQLDAADHLSLREWASMSFSAPDLFAAYGLPEPAENLYQHVRFVTAFHGHDRVDLVGAGI